MAILTDRQRQILALAATGMTAPQIAAELRLVEGTVKKSLGESRTKLGANTTARAILLAYQAGEIS